MLRAALLTVSLLLGCCYGLPSLPDALNKSEKRECALSSQCPANQTCYNDKCEDPCLDVCGSNTDCKLINNSPRCTCKSGFTGHPFTGCSPLAKPECALNSQCPEEESCLSGKCVDPCDGVCGLNSDCRVIKHRPACACSRGFLWNPDTGCQPESSPECTSDALCAPTLACRRQHCVDPCAGVCGNNTVCQVTDHHPACACVPGYTGNPFEECKPQCLSTFMGSGNSTSLERKPQLKKLHLIKEERNWTQAVEYCHSQGMELVSINSLEEQVQVAILLMSEGGRYFWTSGIYSKIFGQYIRFKSRNSLEYTNWNKGEPSGVNLNCIGLLAVTARTWSNRDCEQKNYFVCEEDTLYTLP